MRRIQYGVAISVDGYIAGPNGEADWIQMDPEVDFSAIWSQFDTLLMGRRTYEAATRRLGRETFGGKATFVFSTQLEQKDAPDITIISDLTLPWIQALKNQTGKDIWLMGGGELFRKLLDLGEVNSVSVTTIPVILGGGTPLMFPPYEPTKLTLVNHRVYKSGIISATYEVKYTALLKTKL
jgi:dihydrofolate reductase